MADADPKHQIAATTFRVDGSWQVVPGKLTYIAAGADGSVWSIGVLNSNIGGNYI